MKCTPLRSGMIWQSFGKARNLKVVKPFPFGGMQQLNRMKLDPTVSSIPMLSSTFGSYEKVEILVQTNQ